jgi:hypothetical protein
MNILCLLGRHNFQIAHEHPDGKQGYGIQECTRCSKAVVSDPSLGGSFPILNTRAAIERDTSNPTLPDQHSIHGKRHEPSQNPRRPCRHAGT